MKISNMLIVFIILITVACNSKEQDGHEHGTEDGKHTHDNDSIKTDQEEFKVTETELSLDTIKTSGETKASIITKQQENEITITVPAKKGVEYKFYLMQYEKLSYEWTSEIPMYFDFHGEPLDYEVTKYFESYTEATSDKMKGTMTIPFEGSHGWYWKNESDNEVKVTLKTNGNYHILGLRQ